MDLNGITFVWRQQKAQSNQAKHGVSFERAAEAFFDPFAKLVDASTEEQAREALIGFDNRGVTLFVVHIEIQQDPNPHHLGPQSDATRAERL